MTETKRCTWIPRCQQRCIQRTLSGVKMHSNIVISTMRKISSPCKDIVSVSGLASLKPGGVRSLSGHSKYPGTTCALQLWVTQGTKIDHTWIKVKTQSAIPFHLWASMLLFVMLLQSMMCFPIHEDAMCCSKICNLWEYIRPWITSKSYNKNTDIPCN